MTLVTAVRASPRSKRALDLRAIPRARERAGFHGSDAVAQLKPHAKGGDEDLDDFGFHGSDAVAQLKHGIARRLCQVAVGFPRQRCRGSIEA